MHGSATLTLTEAVTFLAFGRALTRVQLKEARRDQSLGLCPTTLTQALQNAAVAVCDAGYEGQVAIFGTKESDEVPGPRMKLSPVDLVNYRTFFAELDALLRASDVGDEFDLSFSAGASGDFFRDVAVDRKQLEALQRHRTLTAGGRRMSEAEVSDWVASQPPMSADEAHKRFRKQFPHEPMSQASMRTRWRDVRQPKHGRPLKKT